MAQLTSLLPKPKEQPSIEDDEDVKSVQTQLSALRKTVEVPPYGQRKGWAPRSIEDFGDGGAFPEILFPQYPLNMGRRKDNEIAGHTLMSHDAVVYQGVSAKRVVHSKLTSMIGQDIDEDDPSFQKPDDDAIMKTTNETREALEKIVAGKIKASLPKQQVAKREEAQFIRYTPQQQGDGHNSGASNRIIRMVEMPRDPLDPPKFRHKRVARGPPSPPPPVLHSPPRKVTVKEQNEWKIPPCISNWKNPKGYTIPLDKRLAADGRGLQETTISDNFAKLAESLYIADRQAREEIAKRATIQKKLAEKEKEAKEEKLRMLAQRAREERAGVMAKPVAEAAAAQRTAEDEEEAKRDEIRNERRRDIERDVRMSRMGAEQRTKLQKRDEERDVSEKIALGQAQPTMSKEMMFDQRLFNQPTGLAVALGDEEAYNVYDKPFGLGAQASTIYRPRKDADPELDPSALDKIAKTERFVPDKGFQGADKAEKRGNNPVEFEKAEVEREHDPFGLDQFLTTSKAKRGLDVIGNRGSMAASAGNADPTDRAGSGCGGISFESESKRPRQ